MAKTLSISLDRLLDSIEEEIRSDTDSALQMVMWLTIYEKRPTSWAWRILIKNNFFPDQEEPEGGDRAKKIKKTQLRRIDRVREKLEKSVGLPPRGRRGATSEYDRAFSEWKRLNPRPTRDEMLAGWAPQSLPQPDLNQKPSDVDPVVEETTTHSTTKEANSATGTPPPIEKPIEEKEQDPPTRGIGKGAAKARPSAVMTQEEVEESLRLLDADDQADDEINS